MDENEGQLLFSVRQFHLVLQDYHVILDLRGVTDIALALPPSFRLEGNRDIQLLELSDFSGIKTSQVGLELTRAD